MELSVTRFFRYHLNAPWMKEMKLRIKEEAEKTGVTQGTIMDLFPTYEEQCVTGLSERTNQCQTGLYEVWDLGKILDFEINPDTTEQLYDNFSYSKYAASMYKTASNNSFNDMPNPGVQVSIVYSNLLKTNSKTFYK